jgi:hypothetical protein
MLFALTRSNLLKQLPDGNEIILRLTETVIAYHLIKRSDLQPVLKKTRLNINMFHISYYKTAFNQMTIF